MEDVQEQTPPQQKPKRTLKQVAFSIGRDREQKLDELAVAYNRKKGTRIGRNDIARFLFDQVTLEDLLKVELQEYKK